MQHNCDQLSGPFTQRETIDIITTVCPHYIQLPTAVFVNYMGGKRMLGKI